jgi:hypothetical protein
MSTNRYIALAARCALCVGSLLLAVVLAELVIRRIDGWPLWGRLPLAERATDEAGARIVERPDRRHVSRVPIAVGVDRTWYEDTPPMPARIPMPADMAARAAKYADVPFDAFTVWNRAFLQRQVCAGVTDYGIGRMEEEYVFTPPEPGEYPIYRFLPSASPPNWFVTNRYGWRGPDFDPDKDGHTIRIAFVGASTTVGPYSLPFSYPEFVGHWLSRWAARHYPDVRIEVINAARSGIDSTSIAAIVRQEVAPLEPDLLVYYEGSNNFAPVSTLKIPDRWKRERPKFTFRPPSRLEQVSALARRLTSFSVRFAAVDGREPAKGTYPLDWPADVDEEHPDPNVADLPIGLAIVVPNLDSMRRAVRDIGGEFGVASFAWMIPDGRVPLDLSRHQDLYTYLNRTYWPASYAHLRRMAAFQNRVFRAYAARREASYFEVAAELPQDPDLFSDAIHMGEPGLRLQGWILLQQLVPWLDARIQNHVLPRTMRTPLRLHPPRLDVAPTLVPVREIKSACRAS